MISNLLYYSFFSALSVVFGNTGVFTENYNRIYASGDFNNQQPLLNGSNDLNNFTQNSMFDTGLTSEFIIDSVNSESMVDLQVCENFCSINPECTGLFIKDNENYKYQFTSFPTTSTSSTTT